MAEKAAKGPQKSVETVRAAKRSAYLLDISIIIPAC